MHYRGTFILEYIGEVFDERVFRCRRKDYGKDGSAHFYFMTLKADQYIDSTRKGIISRFVNHSCDPNAETQKVCCYLHQHFFQGFSCHKKILLSVKHMCISNAEALKQCSSNCVPRYTSVP